jgi:hypothetical protein
MYDPDENLFPEDSEEVPRIVQFEVNRNDMRICIFAIHGSFKEPFLETYSFLYQIPDANGTVGGVVASKNAYAGTAHQKLCKHRRALDIIYHTAKGKILSRENVKLIFEGRMLNDPEYS